MARILVADDEAHILSVMIDVLEAAGHEVVGVKDGQEALNELRANQFDVALIDVMMPKMDGYHVAAQVHGLPNPPQMVIVTSRDFDGDKRALLASGVAAFLPKPFSNRDLIEVVANLVKRSKGS
jgi:CheY-like chemotaxis protein